MQAGTSRDNQSKTEPDRDRQKHTEVARDRQSKTETGSVQGKGGQRQTEAAEGHNTLQKHIPRRCPQYPYNICTMPSE